MSEQPPSQLVPEAFLSHCSAQRDFVLYLGARLKAHALGYFSSSEPDQGCEPGRPFDESLLQHVRGAKVVVLVLSQQYFGSKWCLKELAEALQVQLQDLGPQAKVLLPVFYGWQRPEQLREWLQQPEQQQLRDSCLKWTGQPLLQLVDSITRMHGVKFPPGSSNPELADQVLSEVRRHIHCQAFPEEQFVGATAWVDWAISHLLQQQGRLGVWGMGGRGKTTLAKALFDRLYEQFDGRAAYVEVGQQPSQEHLMKQQQHILRRVCEADAGFSAPSQGEEALKRSLLAAPRLLIILDDLWEDPARPNMLQWLLPPAVAKACSSMGSWVVVTTRHSSIVTTLLGSGTAQQVPELEKDEEWEVVQLNAYSQLEGWSATDRQVLLQAGKHLPLKLQLLGRQLNIAGPKGYQDVLQRVRDCGNPAEVTQGLDAAFITSYRALPSPLQLAFLDIAMFMRGETKQCVTDWCNAIHGDPIHGRMADDVVCALERRALVTWAGGVGDRVRVHDELRAFVLRYVDLLTAVPERRPEEAAFFWENQQQALRWPSGSSSLAPQRLVAIECVGLAALVSSLPGNPGHPVPAQPKLDSLAVLVMRYGHSDVYRSEPPVKQLRLQGLHNLQFLDIRGLQLTQLQLGELPSLAGLLMSRARLRECRDWGECLCTLPQLQYLRAPACYLRGPLPSSMSECLQHLNLEYNSLQGQLPNSWSALTKLTRLNLSGNFLTGELPSSWSALTNLAEMNLSINGLRGELPNSWSKLASLQQLALAANTLSGPLPPAWSNLGKLKMLWLFDNPLLCGPLPPRWAELTLLQWLNLSRCCLYGPVPEQWSSLRRLERLDLQDNRLTGPVPQWVRQRADTQQLVVHGIDVVPESAPGIHVMPESAPGSGVVPECAPGIHVMPESAPGSGVVPESAPGIHVVPESAPGSGVASESAPGDGVVPESAPGCGCCIA